MGTYVKKSGKVSFRPRPTPEDFMDGKTTRASAEKMAKAANAIIDALLPLSQKKRAEALTLATPD